MEKDLRYMLQHFGDIFVSKVDELYSCLISSTRGFSLTYGIRSLKEEKDAIIKTIGACLVNIRKKNPEADVFKNEAMIKLFYKLDQIEDKIEEYTKERSGRLCSGNPAGKSLWN